MHFFCASWRRPAPSHRIPRAKGREEKRGGAWCKIVREKTSKKRVIVPTANFAGNGNFSFQTKWQGRHLTPLKQTLKRGLKKQNLLKEKIS